MVNSGCANAIMRKKGLEDAWAMARVTDKVLPLSQSSDDSSSETLVLSAGVIGQNLRIDKILSAIQTQSNRSHSLSNVRLLSVLVEHDPFMQHYWDAS